MGMRGLRKIGTGYGAKGLGSGKIPILLRPLFFLRYRSFAATGVPLGTLALPSVLGMYIVSGTLLVIQYLTAEREDGTLLRAKAIPNGIRRYLIGKLVTVSGTILAYLAILLIPGVFIVHGLDIGSVGSWLTFVWVLVLGLVATQPIGAMLGALISTPRGAAYMSLVVGLIAISGVFYPTTSLPHWVAQVFPIYWLGLGMRSALLPASALSVEMASALLPTATLRSVGYRLAATPSNEYSDAW